MRQLTIMQTFKTVPNKSFWIGLTCLLISDFSFAQSQFNGILWGRERSGELQNGSTFNINHYQIMLPALARKKSDERINTWLNIDKKVMTWGTNKRDYYWLSIPIRYQQKRTDNTDLVIHFEPGIMSDFTNLKIEHLFANLQIEGRTWVRHDLDIHYGVMVNREFGNSDPYPVAQLHWQAPYQTDVLLGLPLSKIQTDLSDTLKSYIILKPQGGMWQESTQKTTPSSTAYYQNWRMGIGSNLRWRKNFWAHIELGRNFRRKLSALDKTGVKQNLEIKASYYWQIGLNLMF